MVHGVFLALHSIYWQQLMVVDVFPAVQYFDWLLGKGAWCVPEPCFIYWTILTMALTDRQAMVITPPSSQVCDSDIKLTDKNVAMVALSIYALV